MEYVSVDRVCFFVREKDVHVALKLSLDFESSVNIIHLPDGARQRCNRSTFLSTGTGTG